MDDHLRQLVELALDPRGKWFDAAPRQLGKPVLPMDDAETADPPLPAEIEPDSAEDQPAWDEWDPA